MEKTDRAVVVDGKFRWSDIGSWDAIFNISKRDADNNSASGPVVAVDSSNCLVHAEDRLTAVLGIRDLIVVTTPDAVLVIPRERAEEVKRLASVLKQAGRPEATNHRRCHGLGGITTRWTSPSGSRSSVLSWRRAARLSLQKHLHRSEHWVVVRGTAEVTVGAAQKILHENESAYIRMGTVHRLSNPGKIPLELIEVQTGSYFGEDDIVRLEDVYRRTAAQ
jgi:mannose-1-phosphate guanylyltransferase / mannose-6-phosphate isomerase